MYNSGHHHHHHHHDRAGATVSPDSAAATDVFEQFCSASTFKSVLYQYRLMCDVLRLKPTNFRNFYPKLKCKLRSWKAQAIWGKFDKRSSHKCYNHGKACTNSKVLIIGAGPCGLRTAIEAQLLGAKVVVVEKRDRFSRNNVLHLWPFVINDLKQLGAKKFYGKFCAGAIDHISIRQLQCILLKVALLLGVEIFENVSFEELVEPPEDQNEKIGWRARLSPPEHPANQYEFDVLIGADGKRNTLHGFKRKEFRGKLAIAITANFINKRSEQEARVQEISGVAFIFNQKFFKELYAATGIDLENIVYYKDETHYFVMTAKKQSLIEKGVIIRDLQDTQQLLHSNNVDRNALMEYAREAADFSTNYQLPHLDFAVNHYGKPDVAMFDFTSMFAAENACRMVEKRGHKLLSALVGDSLLEPFWPTGSGCARGFLSSFDACWMIRSFSSGKMTPLEVLAERESIYRLLAQTTPENLSKDYSSYSLDPVSRYPTINMRAVLPFQVRTLFNTDDAGHLEEITNPHLVNNDELPKKRKRRDSFIHPDTLLLWCKKQVALYDSVSIENMTTSFKDGRALCAIIHHYRPDLIDFEALRSEDIAQNNQLVFDILERDYGIPPVMTGREMAECEIPDKLSMISYVSQIYDVFRGEIPHFKHPKMDDGEMEIEHIQHATPHVNILKNLTNKTANVSQGTPASKKKSTLERATTRRDDGRIACHIVDDVSVTGGKSDTLKKTKKRRSDRVVSPQDDIEAHQRREEILANRLERLRKQKERRELDNVRFIRSMQMLQCGAHPQATVQPSFDREGDEGLMEYRKQCVKTMKEKAFDLELKLNHRYERQARDETHRKPLVDHKEEFSDKVRDLEAKFTANSSSQAADKKPKDLIRAIGKIEKSDWNVLAIEKKMHEDKFGMEAQKDRERVPKWNRDAYDDKIDKFHNIERRLRENGEDEETIAKYRDIDASLKRLEMKLREGSTLETGLRGQNKVSNLASQLSSKLEKKEAEKIPITRQPSRPMVPLPTSGSDLCHFCGNRVYLVERLSAEGKFFHRQCFKCDYCAANLRLGNYIYDREGTYGGKFFCIPHFGLTSRARGLRRKVEDTDSAKENIVPPAAVSTPQPKVQVPVVGGGGGATPALLSVAGGAKVGTPTTISPEDRGTTPERVEFENSVVEQSDEEEYLSEDEWTDRNFGASANELDDTDGEEDSDYDLSDEEVEDEEMEFIEGGGTLTAAETRRLAESWQRRYSTDRLDDDDEGVSGHETESDLESDNYSEEYGAEGDESHTATEGEGGDDDDDDDDGEAVKRARELRRMEVNIDVTAPPRKAETSDSGSDTEVASDEESEESDTQIDTDSEFAEDHVQPGPPKEIPTIIIDESQDTHQFTNSPEPQKSKSPAQTTVSKKGMPRSDLIEQKVDLGKPEGQTTNANDKEWAPETGEKSASLTNLNNAGKVDLHAEQLKRLLQRTESTEAIAAKRALQLKRQYLLGESANLPRKSVSTADLGNRFKSFMEKISETQKMLNPAPQPSAAMQAFMSTSVPPRSPISSPSSPHLPARSISLPQGDASSDSTNADKTSLTETGSTESKNITGDITTRVESSVYPVEKLDYEKIEDNDDKVKSFPLSLGSESEKSKETAPAADRSFNAIPVHINSSESSSSESSESESDYDNVPSSHKRSFIHKMPSAIDMQEEKLLNAKSDIVKTSDVNRDDAKVETAVSDDKKSELQDAQTEKSCDKKTLDEHMEVCVSDGDEFGLSKPGDSEGIETVNRELVIVNAPRSLEQVEMECPNLAKEEFKPVLEKNQLIEPQKLEETQQSIDELFDQLANDAVEDIEKFSELVESPELKVNQAVHSELSKLNGNSTTSSERINVGENVHTEETEKATVSSEQSPETPVSVKEIEKVTKEIDISKSSLVEPAVQIVIEESKKSETIAVVESQLSPNVDAESKSFLKSPADDDDVSESKRSHRSALDEDISESKRSLKKDVLSSPEGKELTEAELSDWAGDNEGLSAGEELEFEVNQTSRLSLKKGTSKTIARIASEESLGDTDSAISTGPSKTASVPSKPNVLADLEGIEFMDTGGESASSPEEVSHMKDGYTKLEDDTPTTPVAPQISMVGMENLSGCDSKSSDSTSTELEDSSQSSVQEALNNNMVQEESAPLIEQTDEKPKDIPEEPRSISEPPSLSEKKPKFSTEQRRDSLDDYVTKNRYEGYIPRFKERVSPFGYVRDSLDVRRSSTKGPLFTPTNKDIEERERNENRLDKLSVPKTPENVQLVSPNTAKKQIEKSLKGKDKEKEKDLIHEMVMSRISRKPADKNARRGSRTSISPLSSTSSRTSLFSPQSSQENLLGKADTPVNGSTDNITNGDVSGRKTIHADTKNLLRLDTLKSDLPESGETFTAEENRSKVRVGSAFRQDSVLGSGAKRSISDVNSDLPESGQTFKAEENRAKVRVGALFRDDSVLGTGVKQGSLQDVNVPFADDSQDEDVFVLKEDEKNIVVSNVKMPKSPRKEKSPVKTTPLKEAHSMSHNNLPATPLTHPEQFGQSLPKRELFKIPTTVAPTPPPRAQQTLAAKGMYTPVGIERPVSTPNLSTVEREKVREEARLRAKMKTDLDLGLSPPNLADNLREKLKKGSVSESECDREERAKECSMRTNLAPKVDEARAKDRVRGEEGRKKDKDERVRELLAEQREHRQREPEGKKEEWVSKDDRVRERLEEYRQRRRGSTKSSENGDSRPNSQLLRRTTHRPSLLELESLQVFTSSPSRGTSVTASTISTTNTTPSISSTSSTLTSTADQKSISVVSAPAAVSSTAASPNKQADETPASEKVPEKKSGKKSKDRERRRSLIQVFAGMFSKSGDEKKKTESQQGSDAQDSASKTTAQSTNVAPAETPKCAPKSPSTMRDKLSKLRLSRSKEKKAVEKGRSTSADILDDRGSSDDTRSAFSLPTSPSHRPLSSLTSPFTKASSPPQASGSAYSSSQVRLTTPRIEEESLSDDDGGSPVGTPGGTLDRSGQIPGSGSTSRRQRNAALRAARQAELKRLRMAQEIQRQLEECEVKTRELEERGVAVEKALRGEGGGANRDEAELMGDWFSMVHEKNALVRWEQELMVRAKELELEDRHVRLEHELRRRMALSEHEKSREDIDREGTLLAEILNILEQKDALVNMLEEDRQRYMEEDRDLESVMLRKGLQLSPLRRETGV